VRANRLHQSDPRPAGLVRVVLTQTRYRLRERFERGIEDATNEIAGIGRMVLQRAADHWRELDDTLGGATSASAAHRKDDEQGRREAASLKGSGPSPRPR